MQFAECSPEVTIKKISKQYIIDALTKKNEAETIRSNFEEAIEQIKSDIEEEMSSATSTYLNGFNSGLHVAMELIKKYTDDLISSKEKEGGKE